MDRMACVELKFFPLQLLLQKHPSWKGCPVVVVDQDKPQGIVLYANEQARRLGIRSGMRITTAHSHAPDVRAGVVPPSFIEEGVTSLIEHFRKWSPHCEASRKDPGV